MPRRALFLAPQYDGSYVPHLPGAVQVESELKAVLERSGGYEFNPQRRTVRRAEFHKQLEDLIDTTGEILLYFYGHGVLRGDLGLFVTSDGEPYDEGVPMREVIEKVFQSPAREVIVILDCCHAGAAASAGKQAIQGIVDSCRKAGRVLIAGCASHQEGWTQSTDEQKQIGIFSWHILQGLKGDARLPRSADVRGSSLGTYVTDAFRAWNQSPLSIPLESGDQRCVITSGFPITDAQQIAAGGSGSNALVLGVPFRPSQMFVGRNAELETIRTRLTGGEKPVAVSATVEGLGGVGKTELVIQLLGDPEVLRSYATIVWLDGAGPLPPQWQKIGEDLELEVQALEPKALVDRVSAKLKALGRTLIILDNAAEWRPVEHLIPTGVSLLVTTRTRDFGGTSFRHLELTILSDRSARTLLIRMVPRLEQDSGFQKLITALGGHALAIEIAGGTINTLGISAAEYLARLDTGCPDPEQVLSQVKHGKTVDECLKLTWDTLRSDAARVLWRRASLFAPTSAHRDLLQVSFTADDETMREIRYSLERDYFDGVQISDLLPGNFDSAYAELRSRNVFSRVEGADGERWAMHRLVRDFGRARLKTAEFFVHSMAISEWLRSPTIDLGPEIPHIVALILDSAKFGTEFESRRGRSRKTSSESLHRSSRFLLGSEYFLHFIRSELNDPKALAMLLDGLTDVNDDVRKQAIIILETLPHIPEVIEGIANALDDPDPSVRALARKTITESGTAKVVHVLEKTLSTSKSRAKLEAVRCLGKLGKDAIPALRSAFTNETGDLKFEAAVALAELGNDLGLADLVPAAMSSEDQSIREKVLTAVRWLPGEEVNAVYVRSIKDDNKNIRCRALRALIDYQNLELVEECLNEVLSRVTVKDRTESEEVGLAMDIALKRELTVPSRFLKALLNSDNWVMREKAARCLAWSSGEGILPLLKKALGDDDYDVRESAVKSVAKRSEVALLQVLRTMSVKDDTEDVKKAASKAVKELTGKDLDPITAFKGNVATRVATATAMGNSNDPKYVDLLLTELKSKSPTVRAAVAEALGNLRTIDADQDLYELAANDPNKSVRNSSSIALLQVRCPAGKDDGEGCGTAEALRNTNLLGASEIVDALTNCEATGVCSAMMRAIAKRASEPGAKKVFKGLKDPDEFLRSMSDSDDWQTRVYAIAALARSKDSDTTASLIKLLEDENATVRRDAAAALGLVGGLASKARLESVASEDEDEDVRNSACQALESLR